MAKGYFEHSFPVAGQARLKHPHVADGRGTPTAPVGAEAIEARAQAGALSHRLASPVAAAHSGVPHPWPSYAPTGSAPPGRDHFDATPPGTSPCRPLCEVTPWRVALAAEPSPSSRSGAPRLSLAARQA